MPRGGPAGDHCAVLLEMLGYAVERTAGGAEPHPDLVWAASGAMALTGAADGPPLLAPAALASCARGALQALRLLAPAAPALATIDGARLLGERAACLRLRRHGVIAPAGTCRLLRARDGWLAVNLARPSDIELLPAWLGPEDVPPNVVAAVRTASEPLWDGVRRAVAGRNVDDVVERARLLGMPVAPAADAAARPSWLQCAASGDVGTRPARARPLVIDLSTLWAGPLAASLLGQAGARVIKVESVRRPDGARQGPRAFHDLLNAGKESVALDLASTEGRRALRALLGRADIVVESARPRALRHLGIDAAALVAAAPELVWIAITGYGRSEPGGSWVAFGDDAAAAAGLATATGRLAGTDGPLFCGDAIADPLTGMHAAVAALALWQSGRGALVDLALRDVTAHLLASDTARGEGSMVRRAGKGGWEVVHGGACEAVVAPMARTPLGTARPLGADTAAVLAELGPSAAPACPA